MLRNRINGIILVLCLILVIGCQESEAQTRNDFVLDLFNFRYLEEYPDKIVKVQEVYPSLTFTEKIWEAILTQLGDYSYVYKTEAISFVYNGDNKEDAVLYNVEIKSLIHQKPNAQIIGMNKEDLIELLSEDISFKNNEDELIIESPDFKYFLRVHFLENKVIDYKINRSL